jgi:transposase
MRFVATKTLDQQSYLMLHRTRHLFIRPQTAVINAIRGHPAEFGIVAPVGRNGVEHLLSIIADRSDRRLPGGTKERGMRPVSSTRATDHSFGSPIVRA